MSFFQLVDKNEKNLAIEIPRIQRDYAQGRKSASVNDVRNDFLSELKKYLDSDKPYNNLDFVYGDITDGKLTILDGQQRITTLFLLHWYTALVAGKYGDFSGMLMDDNKGKSRFYYDIRESSNDFCNELVRNGADVFKKYRDQKNRKPLSQIIEDQTWFFLNWRNDLTVKSMLVMIDAIQEKFGDNETYFEKLAGKTPWITFDFLPMKIQGLTDELYIKMNSRGRELTRFENLKSKLLGKFDDLIRNAKNPDSASELKNLKGEFALKIDTDWIDVFWDLRIPGRSTNHFDAALLNFFEAVFVNEYALAPQREPKKVKSFIDAQARIPFSEMADFGGIKELLRDYARILNGISDGNKLRTYFAENPYYAEEETFRKIIFHGFSDAAYEERLLFFAYCYFFIHSEIVDATKYWHWIRVASNIIRNSSPFNNESEFCNALSSIKILLDSCGEKDVYDVLPVLEKDLTGLDKSQVWEEKVKVILMKDENWKNEILSAEKHAYFKSQLKFALDYAGFSKETALSDVPKKAKQPQNLAQFKECVKRTFALFTDEGISSAANENACLQRAILSKGDYLLQAGSNWSFLINNDRDVSWKVFLKGDRDSGRRRFYYEVIFDDLFDESRVSDSLEKICGKSAPNMEAWRKCLIRFPELLSNKSRSDDDPIQIGNKKFVRWNSEDEIFILSGQQMNSYHSELYTAAKYYELKGKLSVSPFKSLWYYNTATKEEEPCFNINEWRTGGDKFCFSIDGFYCGDGKFSLLFFDRNNRERKSAVPFPQDLANALSDFGFREEEHREYSLIVDGALLEKTLEKLLARFELLGSSVSF